MQLMDLFFVVSVILFAFLCGWAMATLTHPSRKEMTREVMNLRRIIARLIGKITDLEKRTAPVFNVEEEDLTPDPEHPLFQPLRIAKPVERTTTRVRRFTTAQQLRRKSKRA